MRTTIRGSSVLVMAALLAGCTSPYELEMRAKSQILRALTSEDEQRAIEIYRQYRESVPDPRHFGSDVVIMASEGNDTLLLRYLLDQGEDPAAISNNGMSAIHFTAQNGCLEAAKILVNHGVDMNIQDKEQGRTPLFIAAECNRGVLCRFLLEQGADPSLTDLQGRTPLDISRAKWKQPCNETSQLLEAVVAKRSGETDPH